MIIIGEQGLHLTENEGMKNGPGSRLNAGSCKRTSLRPALLTRCPYLSPSSYPHQGPVFCALAQIFPFQIHFHWFSSFVVVSEKTLYPSCLRPTSTLCPRFYLFPLPVILLFDLDFPPPCYIHCCLSASPGFAQSDGILPSRL